MLTIPLLLAALLVAVVATALVVWRGERRASERVLESRQEARARGAHEPRLEHPWVDRSRCIGCAACVRACPEGGVLDILHGQAAIVQGSRCVGHGRCAEECPVGAIALTLGDRARRDDLPALTENLEAIGRRGLWLAGEVTGYALIRTAVEHGRRAAQAAARRVSAPSDTDVLDLVIVGAGPAGFACSLEARRLGLRFVTLEREELGGTIARYPRRKLLMTRSLELPLGGPLQARGYQKEELIQMWTQLATEHDLPIREGVSVQRVAEESPDLTSVETDQGTFRTRSVVLAVGRRGLPRKLGVPGEERLKVAYSLIDAQAFRGRKILVVGGGDSAVEAALGLAAQSGNTVYLSYRRAAFFRLRTRNEMRVLAAIADGSIHARLETQLLRIDEQSVELRHADGATEMLGNDEVFLMLGGEPPFPMLREAGVSFDPEHHPPLVQEAERGVGLKGALAVAAAAAMLLLVARWTWADYYAAGPLLRREMPEHLWLHSAHGAGWLAGLAALAMMGANLAYLARRAPRFPLRWGSLRSWMNVHVATGLLALVFALFHATFLPLDSPGGRAFWGLVALVITGAIGRYLYSFVPRAANGRELAYEEARQRLRETTSQWSELHRLHGERARLELARLLEDARWAKGRWGTLHGLLRSQSSLAVTLRRLRVKGIAAGVPRDELNEVLQTTRQAHRDALAATFYGELRTLLAGWRYFHRWGSLLVIGLVMLHVWAGWRYADLGGRG